MFWHCDGSCVHGGVVSVVVVCGEAQTMFVDGWWSEMLNHMHTGPSANEAIHPVKRLSLLQAWAPKRSASPRQLTALC